MGNDVSFDLVLPQGNLCHAGQHMNGSVELLVKNRIPKKPIFLQLYGKEKVQIRSAGNPNGGSSAERRFFNLSKKFDDMGYARTHVVPGRYSFPFSIHLPQSLPSSDEYPRGSSNSRSDGYRIQYKAKVWYGQHESKAWYFSVQSASLPDERVPLFVRPQSLEIGGPASVFGGKTLGQLLLTASVEDIHVGRTHSLMVDVACRNDSRKDIQRVEITLLERLTWQTKTVDDNETKELVLFNVPDVQLPKLMDRQGKSKDTVRVNTRDEETMQRNQAEIYEEIRRDMVEGGNKLRIPIHQGARDTFSGSLVKVEHFLKIKLQTGIGVTNPSIRVPIRIGTPPSNSERDHNFINNSSSATVPVATLVPLPLPSQSDGTTTTTTASMRRNEGSLPEPSAPPFSSTQGLHVPLIAATAIPDSETITIAPTLYASTNVIQLGGDAIVGMDSAMSMEDYEGLVPLAPLTSLAATAPPEDVTPSLQLLYNQMVASVDDYDIIQNHLRDESWRRLFQTMTPEDYGMVITYVTMDSDQPRTASLLAAYVNGRNNLTCRYVAAAVKGAADCHKATLVQKLLPSCVDIVSNRRLIEEELSEWDLVITRQNFEAAVASARR